MQQNPMSVPENIREENKKSNQEQLIDVLANLGSYYKLLNCSHIYKVINTVILYATHLPVVLLAFLDGDTVDSVLCFLGVADLFVGVALVLGLAFLAITFDFPVLG